MEKYFPHTLTTTLKAQITGFKLDYDETIYTAFERFQDLTNKCPHHGFELSDLVQHFYNGLTFENQQVVDFQCRGNIWEETAEAVWAVFERLAKGSQFKDPRAMVRRRGPEAPPTQEAPMYRGNGDQFECFTNELKQVLKSATGTTVSNEVCRICKNYGHGAHMCRSELAYDDGNWAQGGEEEAFSTEFGTQEVSYGQDGRNPRGGFWRRGFRNNQGYAPANQTYGPNQDRSRLNYGMITAKTPLRKSHRSRRRLY